MDFELKTIPTWCTHAERVASFQQRFPKYPGIFEDKGWLYGVWYCSTAFKKSEMYGEHPGNYRNRVIALFPECKEWLHAPGGIVPHGMIDGRHHVTVDLVSRKEGFPSIIANVTKMPFKDESFDIVESDPPYGQKHCQVYGTPKYQRYKAMDEFWRVLKPGGYLVWLDTRYPAFKRGRWKQVGLIGVVTGFERLTRICAIYKKTNGEEE
jgi:hypothetical protein